MACGICGDPTVTGACADTQACDARRRWREQNAPRPPAPASPVQHHGAPLSPAHQLAEETAGHIKRVGGTLLDWLFADDDRSFLQGFDKQNGTNLGELHDRVKKRSAETAGTVAGGLDAAGAAPAPASGAGPCEACGGRGAVIEQDARGGFVPAVCKVCRGATPAAACATCGGKKKLGNPGHEVACPACVPRLPPEARR